MIQSNRLAKSSTLSGKDRLLHLITGLNTGGAEMMLYKLLVATDRTRFEPVVISMTGQGTIGPQIEALGVPVYWLGMSRGLPTPLALGRLVRLVRRLRPALIQSWMYHANLAASLASRLSPKQMPVVWNVRHSLHDLESEKWLTRLMIRLGAKLSAYPGGIIYNAQVSARQHEAIGYRAEQRQVIPNGFDCEHFQPSSDAYARLRHSLGVGPETLLIGLIARYHPVKDHATFIKAAGPIASRYPYVHFVMVGREINKNNLDLQKRIETAHLQERVHLLGERTDIPEIMAGLDIATNSSRAEGFPNVVGEAMACGVPCVVTDVGDSAWVVGDTGRVIPARQAEALVDAWASLIEGGTAMRTQLGQAARQRILENFALPTIVNQYETFYQQLLQNSSACVRQP